MKMNATDFNTVANMGDMGGGFVRALARAMQLADPDNLERIKAAFPEIIERYRPASAIVTPPPITASVTQQGSTTQYMHNIAEVQIAATSPNANQLDADDIEVDGVILVRCYRDRGDIADTCNQSVFLHFVDIHYQTDRTATINKAPNFYG
jgi:hypothetical protein